ncbi:glycoside hydrolase family 43 protein [Pedococcus sp. 5OH_020]|uniref:glycoside hydrolase family 43 protein n=1 Tax=Pedococcus sp. 5OH_020 TaxID=2989814 RepID=UPI0022EA0B4A|nr:glycoside hydrolase family 43 protein [Pedococcus sp. 5OH_020]
MPVTYANPLYDGYFADPFVMRVGDRYVAVGTGRVVGGRTFEVLTSPDLVSWTSVGGALETPPGLGTDFWAPEVAQRDGRFYLYYSAGNGDAGHHLRVAVADSATGPYVDQGVDLTPDERFAIDPHPLQAQDGAWYLYFAHDVLEGERAGTMLAVARLGDDMTSLDDEVVEVLRPTADWQIYQRDRQMYGAQYDWHTLEGPAVCFREGRYWCFYSAGSWLEPTYAVGWAVSDHPLGPWTAPDGVEPLMRTIPGKVVGPGHNSIVTTPGGTDVIVYHAWDAQMTARRLCIDPLLWTPDGPTVDGPSYGPRDLPD